MSAKTKRLLITTERHELFVVHALGGAGVAGFCPVCSADVELMTVDSVVSATGLRTREVFARVANDELHSIEAANGHLLICKNSLNTEKEPDNDSSLSL